MSDYYCLYCGSCMKALTFRRPYFVHVLMTPFELHWKFAMEINVLYHHTQAIECTVTKCDEIATRQMHSKLIPMYHL